MKLFRDEEETIIEKIKDNKDENQEKKTEEEDKIKIGEIIKEDSKYYYKPNLKESYYINFDINNNKDNEYSSFLIYKGNNIPPHKNRYKIKEGDVLKLGREWLFVKEIHISNITKKKLKLKLKDKINGISKKIFYNHSLTNKELNIQDDINIIEYNDTEEDKDDDINNKFATENDYKRNVKEITLKEGKKIDVILKDNESSEKNSNNNVNNLKNKKVKICRICYIEEYDMINNPLIKPCKCSGSMKYIHYDCLLHWIRTKIIDKTQKYYDNDYSSIFNLELVECELCKTRLPDYIRHKNEIYSLLNLDKDFDEEKILINKNEKINKRRKESKSNYIIFDTVSPSKTDNRYRYLVKFDKNNILRIGRGLEMQLILNDISVSRNHCQLKIDDNGNILLEDHNSKFGSLVLIQDKIEILKGQNLYIQVGTNYLTLALKKKSGLFSCCNTEEIDMRNSYEKLNSLAIKYNKNNQILDESITIDNSENENEEENKKLINDEIVITKIEENNNSNDLIIFDQEKTTRNRKIKENNNFDSTCNGSTLILKDNQVKEIFNKKSNNKNNIRIIRKEINKIKKNPIDGIKSENIIISEGEENKSNKENEIKMNKVEDN